MSKVNSNNINNSMKREKCHTGETFQARIHLILTKEKVQIQAEIKLNNNSNKITHENKINSIQLNYI